MPGVIRNAIRFINEQWTTIPVPTTSLKGKNIVLVGANVGLGFEAAKHLAQLGPDRLVITSRDAGKGEEGRKLIAQGATSGQLDLLLVDFALFESVRQFADKVDTELSGKLDVLLINSALATNVYSPTEDGWERTLQVNYVSNALLSILLLPTLIKSGTVETPSRLINVSSDAHYLATLDEFKNAPGILDALNAADYCTPKRMGQRYPVSKLLGLLFTRALAARLPASTAITLGVNPGFCHSQLTREADQRALSRTSIRFFKALFARTTEMGSRTLVHAVTDSGEREFHGRFVSTCKPVAESDWVVSAAGAKATDRLWDETITILSKIDPRVEGIVKEYLSEPAAQTA